MTNENKNEKIEQNQYKYSHVYVKNMKSYYDIVIDEDYINFFNKNKTLNLQMPLSEFAYVKMYPKVFETGRFTKIVNMVLLVLLAFSIFILEVANMFFMMCVGIIVYGLYVLYQKEKLTIRFYIREPEENFCYGFKLVMRDLESRNSIYKVLKHYNKIGFNHLSNFKLDLNYFNKLKG